MKALRSFTVRARLPEALVPVGAGVELPVVVGRRARDLFRWVDPTVGTDVPRPGPPPGQVSRERLSGWRPTRASWGFLDEVHTDLRRFLDSPGWFQNRRRVSLRAVAYFSPEFGIAEACPSTRWPRVLAGDHLKAASSLGVP